MMCVCVCVCVCHNILIKKKSTHLALSNVEVLIAVVNDGILWTAGSDVANTLHAERHN